MDASELAAWRAFLNAHAAVTQRIDTDLKTNGLPPLTWYDVLWPLEEAERKRLRMNDLAQKVVLSRTGLVRLVDRLEAAGLIRREAVPEDRRGSYAAITPAGTATLRRMWPIYRRNIEQHFLEPLGGNVGRMRAALERVVDGQS